MRAEISQLIEKAQLLQVARTKGTVTPRRVAELDQAIADLERVLIPSDAREKLADALEASGVLAVYGDPLDVADSLLSALTQAPTDDSPLTHNPDNDSPDRETITPTQRETSDDQ